MQTGQNPIAPENSLPQLGQVRWGSALMLLIAVQSHPQPETTPFSTDWSEIGQHSASHTLVPLRKQSQITLH
jgi:hypothetical protein